MTQTTETRRRFHRAYSDAVHRLVHGFNSLQHEAIKGIAAENNEELYAFPMWGTCFQPVDSCDRSRIREMLCSFEPTTEEEADELVSDYGLDVEKDEYRDEPTNAEEEGDLDEDAYIEAVIDAWREGDYEEEMLASSGWQRVGDTGILALDYGGDDLFLGINGAAFSFYGNLETGDRSGLWARLYDALGYEWHHRGFRADVVGAATRALCRTEEGTDAERAAIARLRAASYRADQGGPLTPEEIAEGEAIDDYGY